MNKLLKQGIIVYQFTIVLWRVSRILFFPSTLKDWFSIDESIRNSETISTFKNRLFSFIRLFQNNIFNIFDPTGLNFLTLSRSGFSHLNEHKFRHNFHDCMNPFCSCSIEIEDTLHYLLHCHHFNNICIDLMNSAKSVYDNFESLSDKDKKRYAFIWWLTSRQNQK